MQNVVKTSQENTLSGVKLCVLNQALDGLNHEQLSWVSGYVSGLRVGFLPAPVVLNETPVLTVLYASQGGNARNVAESMATNMEIGGFSTRLISAENYKPRSLLKETYLLVVVSTQGEGEAPESAQELFRYLSAKKKPKLENLQYAIFGLGDSSYEYFCKAAQDMDTYFKYSGAKTLLPRVDADVSFQTQAEHWGIEVLQELEKVIPVEKTHAVPLAGDVAIEKRPDSSNPYKTEVLENRRLTSLDAVGAVYHLALEIDPAAVSYQPGDAVGVFFKNAPEIVAEVLEVLNFPDDQQVTLSGSELMLSQALTEKLELTLLHPTVVKAWSEISKSRKLKTLCEDRDKLRAFANNNQFIDLLLAYPAEVDADALANLLLPIKPRLYSIASSQSAYEDEIHITVTTLEYEAFGRSHLGGASGYLTQRTGEGDPLDIYIAENPSFRLPADDVPVIMIGAGTGIAPFRAFLQERESRGSSGENWLIFGNRNFHRDFLYQSEWLNYRKQGLLQRASVAFSRDDEERVYVQNRLHQEGEEVYSWLQKGAYIYVCGGIDMEKSVMASLVDIAKSHGGMSDDNAEEFINTLHSQGRYSRDVY